MSSEGGAFELEILIQWWMGALDDARDTCSHGAIRAVIGGTEVTSHNDPDYGISQSALLLLRTVEKNFSEPMYQRKRSWLGGSVAWSDKPFVHYLLCHGCGYPHGFGCTNFGTSWNVTHEDDLVLLSSPVLYSPELPGHRTNFEVSARIPLAEYRRKVVAFADEAHRFYFAAPRRVVEEIDRPFHDAFWQEFEERLERAKEADAETRC